MARPTKQGIDFFSLDCDPEAKLELFIAENGAEGFGILVMLWQMIYKGEGYFIRHDDDLVWLIRKESLSEPETIVSVIENAIKRGLFDKTLYEVHKILSSTGIQKRYFAAAKKKKEIFVVSDYLLIDVSDNNNLVYSGENPVLATGNDGLGVSAGKTPVSGGGNATKEKVKVKEEEESSPCDMSSREAESGSDLPKVFLDSAYHDEAYEFADWFRSIAPGKVKFDRDKWAVVWYHLRQTDRRTDKEELFRAIQWARGDPFWSTNFQSPLKLRKRNDDGMMYIDVFIEKMKNSNPKNHGKGTSRTNGNPHAIANAKMLAALERGDFAESAQGARDGPG